MFIVFSHLGLLSCIEFCIFLCCLVLFDGTLGKWLAGKTYSCDIYRVEGFNDTDDNDRWLRLTAVTDQPDYN